MSFLDKVKIDNIEYDIQDTAARELIKKLDENKVDKKEIPTDYITENDMSEFYEKHKEELKGEKGADGIAGPQGPKGNTGDIGPQGPRGEKGADGNDGINGEDGTDGVGISSVVQTKTSNVDGGTNVITVTRTNGATSTFSIKNGSKGSTGADGKNGADGVGITSIKQTTTSSADGGTNIITVTRTNGATSTFSIKNGSKGDDGEIGRAHV